jgi:hypothetical protein
MKVIGILFTGAYRPVENRHSSFEGGAQSVFD